MATLEITKQTSILDGRTYYEMIDANRISALLKSNCLIDKWKNEKYIQELAGQHYKNEKEQLESFFKNYDKMYEMIAVKYKKCNHKYGRNYVVKSLGFTGFCKQTRNTLLKDSYYDFDLENAQLEIIRNICVANNILCPIITDYCINRANYMEELSKEYNVKPKDVKNLFLRISFGGSFSGWCYKNDLQDALPNDLIVKFAKEMAIIMIAVKKANPILYKAVSQSDKKKDNNDNLIGSFFAIYLQEYENRIIENIIKWLDETADVITHQKTKRKILTYEFDGIKLYKHFVDQYDGGKEKLLQDLNENMLKISGFNIKMTEKPIEVFHDISEELKYLNNTNDAKSNFEILADEFELTHFKIVDKGLYIEETDDNRIVTRTSKEMEESYNHLIYEYDTKGKPLVFINKWIRGNSNIRKYNNMDLYPNEYNCPKTTYNLWRPFNMELVDKYTEKKKELEKILNHFKIICNNDENVYDYVMYFIAHIIQRPYEKPTTCLHFQSTEGAGKSTIIQLLKDVMGSKKVFITSKPQEYVWGKFTSLMRDPLLVVIEELEKKYLTDTQGVFKDLVTNPTITIEDKCKTAFEMKSFHRFISFTNKEDGGINTNKNDRRNLIIKCSDELIGNKDYFAEFYNMIADKDVVKTFYEYLKSPSNFTNMENFINMKIPKTEIQETLKELSRSCYDLWVEDFVRENIDDDNVRISSYDCYAKFIAYLNSNGYSFKISNIKFGVNLKLLNLDGLEHSRKTDGCYWVFDIIKLKSLYKIE